MTNNLHMLTFPSADIRLSGSEDDPDAWMSWTQLNFEVWRTLIQAAWNLKCWQFYDSDRRYLKKKVREKTMQGKANIYILCYSFISITIILMWYILYVCLGTYVLYEVLKNSSICCQQKYQHACG